MDELLVILMTKLNAIKFTRFLTRKGLIKFVYNTAQERPSISSDFGQCSFRSCRVKAGVISHLTWWGRQSSSCCCEMQSHTGTPGPALTRGRGTPPGWGWGQCTPPGWGWGQCTPPAQCYTPAVSTSPVRDLPQNSAAPSTDTNITHLNYS